MSEKRIYIVQDTHIKKDKKTYAPGAEIELTGDEARKLRVHPKAVMQPAPAVPLPDPPQKTPPAPVLSADQAVLDKLSACTTEEEVEELLLPIENPSRELYEAAEARIKTIREAPESGKPKAREVIALIQACKTVEEVNRLVVDDKRLTVIDAAAKRTRELNSPKE